MKRYLEIADKLEYISCKVDQLTSAKKEEIRAVGKEVPSTLVIPDSDDEEDDENDDETECVDLTEGSDDIHEQALKVADPTEEAKKQLIIKVKTEKIEANQVPAKETGHTA